MRPLLARMIIGESISHILDLWAHWPPSFKTTPHVGTQAVSASELLSIALSQYTTPLSYVDGGVGTFSPPHHGRLFPKLYSTNQEKPNDMAKMRSKWTDITWWAVDMIKDQGIWKGRTGCHMGSQNTSFF